MKIKKWIELREPVEVEVSIEDVTQVILEAPDSGASALRGIDSVRVFLKGITNEMISHIHEGRRMTVHDFLVTEASRYRNEDDKQSLNAGENWVSAEDVVGGLKPIDISEIPIDVWRSYLERTALESADLYSAEKNPHIQWDHLVTYSLVKTLLDNEVIIAALKKYR
jgi:hypothetical protein